MTKESISLTIVTWCLVLLLFGIETSEAVLMKIPTTGHKCVSEEIRNNVIVMAGYVTYPDEHTYVMRPVSVVVTSPHGNNIHHQENVTHGEFAFTSSEEGAYLACFWVDNSHGDTGGDISVNLDWKTGIAAKDWDSFAKKEKIEGVELELKKLEEAVEAIHESLIYLKGREAHMRTFSEKTNSRVALFSIISLGICIGVSALQLWHLKTYFQKKKLV